MKRLAIICLLLILAGCAEYRETLPGWEERLVGTDDGRVSFLLAEREPDLRGVDSVSGKNTVLFRTETGEIALSWARMGTAEVEIMLAFTNGDTAASEQWTVDLQGGEAAAACSATDGNGRWYSLSAQASGCSAEELIRILRDQLTVTIP